MNSLTWKLEELLNLLEKQYSFDCSAETYSKNGNNEDEEIGGNSSFDFSENSDTDCEDDKERCAIFTLLSLFFYGNFSVPFLLLWNGKICKLHSLDSSLRSLSSDTNKKHLLFPTL